MDGLKDNVELIEKIKAGNQQAFKFLFETYHPRLCNYASRFVEDEEAAQDIVQDCFVHLWECRKMVASDTVAPMLFTMVRNKCLNHIKHLNIVRNYERELSQQNNGEELLYRKDFWGNSDEKVLYEELKGEIMSQIDKLPPRTREVFMLSRFEGLKNREIAEQLNIAVKVVEKHITKTLKALADVDGTTLRKGKQAVLSNEECKKLYCFFVVVNAFCVS